MNKGWKPLVMVLAFLIPTRMAARTTEEKFWIDYLSACSPAAQLDGKAYYIGSANQIGPGSVWGLGGGSVNLVADQKSYLGEPDAKGQYRNVQYPSISGSCTAQGSRAWDLSIGLPFNISAIGNASLTLALKSAKSITIQVNAVRVDSIGIAQWSDATDEVDRTTTVFQQAVDGHHYLMTAADAILGMEIKFTGDDSFAAKVTAATQISKTVQLGTASTPVQAELNLTDSGKTATITIPASALVYPLAKFQPVERMKTTDILKTQTVTTPAGTKTIYSSKPRVRGTVAQPN
jgi:hypothetical protein